MWNPGWDEVYCGKEWGKYPPEELVRFVGRNFLGVSDRKAVKFLEIGCGAGANLLFLTKEQFTVFGLDGSQVALDRAHERLVAEGLVATLAKGDAVALFYPDQSFDCVIDLECMYANSLADSRRIVAEAHRVLKPGGLFFSKTFMTGTSGEATAIKMTGESNTYLSVPNGPFNAGYGIIRLTAEDEIPGLYGIFSRIEWDHVIRTDRNRRYVVREWLITCQKVNENSVA